MIPTPAHLVDAVTSHHRPIWSVTGTGGAWPVTGGRITLSRTSNPNVLVEADIAQLTGNPSAVAGQFLPFGSDASVTWGVHPWPDRITVADTLPVVVTTVRRPDSLVKVKLQDPAAIIAKHTIPESEVLGSPATCLAAAQLLVQRTYPGHTVADPTGQAAATTAPDDWRQANPWAGVQRAAQAAGLYPVYTDATTVTLYAEPATTGPAVDHLSVADAIISYDITYQRAYSRVILQYDNVDGVWTDPGGVLAGLPPSTYVEKREGTVLQATADAAAIAWGQRAAGKVASLSLECIPRPWLQPGDRIQVTLLNDTTSLAIIDQITLPLDGSPMRIQLRNSDYIGPAEF